MFSEHAISCSLNGPVLKSRVPARTVPAGTRSNNVLGTNRPLSTLLKLSLNYVKPRTCSNWAGLSTQTTISTESSHWNDLISLVLFFYTLRSVYTTSHTAQTEMCADLKSERRGTENILIVLAIWTLVYQELVSRTVSRVRVPRTYMNGPKVSV